MVEFIQKKWMIQYFQDPENCPKIQMYIKVYIKKMWTISKYIQHILNIYTYIQIYTTNIQHMDNLFFLGRVFGVPGMFWGWFWGLGESWRYPMRWLQIRRSIMRFYISENDDFHKAFWTNCLGGTLAFWELPGRSWEPRADPKRGGPTLGRS